MLCIKNKKYWIDLLRENGFNCFPIPKENEKGADYRYNGSRTKLNQIISDNENFGYIPLQGKGNCILDIDNKEKYRGQIVKAIEKGYVVIETGAGWQIPVIGLVDNSSKIELFDYGFKDNKIIEIQGINHYCMGIGSIIQHKKLGKEVTYQNVGGDKIMNVNGMDYHTFIENICKIFNVTSKKPNNTSATKYLRDQFTKEIPPTKGHSNMYFFEASRFCNTEGLTQKQAEDKIKIIYDKWVTSEYYSGRSWKNILFKINDVYTNNYKVTAGRSKGSNNGTVDRTVIAQEITQSRDIYSNVTTKTIYENKGGFLVNITDKLQKELVNKYPQMSHSDYKEIIFKVIGLGKDIPKTNKDLVVFKNGVYSRKLGKIIETSELADMGFKEYDYLPSTPENMPHKFIEIMYSNVISNEKARINAGLKSGLTPLIDPKISVIHGLSGVGKSTGLQILSMTLGDYALQLEYDQYINDPFIRAKIEGKTLLVFQDMPKEWGGLEKIKTVTGELVKTERGFYKDSKEIEIKIKIWASANYLPEIPEHEKESIFGRRLSLIKNTRTKRYEEDPTLIPRIYEEEGEKIISWILNLPDNECEYESSEYTQTNWEKISSPAISYIEENYTPSINQEVGIHIVEIMNDIKQKDKIKVELKQLKNTLREMGFTVKDNVITNAKKFSKQVESKFAEKVNQKLDSLS
jgi:hypothetical protein